MEYLQFTDFRNHSKEYFNEIENGQTYIIIRKGKPVAQINPFHHNSAGWKRSIEKIKLKTNITTTELLAKERSD